MELNSVPLGNTGLQVSELAIGTARFGTPDIDRQTAHELLDAYVDEYGGNFIDTADIYADGRAEQYIGEWLEDRDREDFVIASKIYHPIDENDPNRQGLNRKHLRRQLNQILDRLGTDYLDLLYIHRWDDETPAEEFLRTLDEFVADGRVHYLGASTRDPNAWKVAKGNEIAEKRGYEPFSVTQTIYNLVDRQAERNYIDMCEDYDLGLLPFSPLAEGFLTGKYERGVEPPEGSRGAQDGRKGERFRSTYLNEENFHVIEEVREIAAEYDSTPAQISLAWLLAQDVVTALVAGQTSLDQLEDNVAMTEIDLPPELVERMNDLATP